MTDVLEASKTLAQKRVTDYEHIRRNTPISPQDKVKFRSILYPIERKYLNIIHRLERGGSLLLKKHVIMSSPNTPQYRVY